jgi:hypothetical protein
MKMAARMKPPGPALLLLALLAGCKNPSVLKERIAPDWLLHTGYRLNNEKVVEDHPVIGLEVATREPGSGGWGIEAGTRFGWGTEDIDPAKGATERESWFYELTAGVRQTYRGESRARPYFGLGAAWMRNENWQQTLGPEVGFDLNGLGAYAHTGVLWRFGRPEPGAGRGLLLGLDLRGMLGDDTSYVELALVSGFGQ